MNLLKSDIPYLLEVPTNAKQLSNGLDYRLIWEYTLNEGIYKISFEGHQAPIIAERVIQKHLYQWQDYCLTVSAVGEWQYLDHDEADYAEAMLGYRGYWQGEVLKNGQVVLQPEVAVLLGYTPDWEHVPAYIETISTDELRHILAETEQFLMNDDALAFSQVAPIGAPITAPQRVEDALRRMRAQSKILITRGRAIALKSLSERTGVIADSGGWRLMSMELLRRQNLGLR